MTRPHNAAMLARRVGPALTCALALAGCGEIKNTIVPAPGSANTVTVALAGRPNAFDVGLYDAEALGYFQQSDIDLRIVVPRPDQDPVTMLNDGRVLVAFSSEPNVLLHRNQIQPVVSIAAIVHAPLPQIAIPTPPAGPSGGASLTQTTNSAAGTTATNAAGSSRATTTHTATTRTTTSHTRTTGTSTTGTSTTGATATSAATTTTTTTTVPAPDAALWPAALRQLLSEPGYPTYDGLVVVVRKDSIVDQTGLVRRFVQTLARGYRAARADPRQAIANLIAAVPSLEPQRAFELNTLRAAIPYFFPPGLKVWGYERQSQWNAFGTWLTDHHLLTDPYAITDASTNELLAGQGI